MTANAPNSTAPKTLGADKLYVRVSAISSLNALVTRFEFQRVDGVNFPPENIARSVLSIKNFLSTRFLTVMS